MKVRAPLLLALLLLAATPLPAWAGTAGASAPAPAPATLRGYAGLPLSFEAAEPETSTLPQGKSTQHLPKLHHAQLPIGHGHLLGEKETMTGWTPRLWWGKGFENQAALLGESF